MWYGLGVAAALLLLRYLLPSTAKADPDAPTRLARQPFTVDSLVVGLGFLLAPTVVLTLHPQKSEVVLSALAPGVALLVIALWSAILPPAPWPGRPAPKWQPIARFGLGATAILAAMGYFAERQTRPLETPEAMAGFRQVNALADDILTRAESAHLATIRVSVDHITDALDAQVLRVVCYERHHIWRDWDMKLPTGIAAPDPVAVRQRIAESDFVFLTDDDSIYAGYPFDKALAKLRPELRAWCEAHLAVARRFNLQGHPVTLYRRRELMN